MTVQPRPSTGLVPADLRLQVVETMAQLQPLHSAWQDLEARDPEGTVYLSWDWLAATFAPHPGRWRVLAAWHGARLVAVFPIKLRLHWSETQQELQTEIEAGGRLIYSEYTGFLCDPEHQNAALAIFAQHLQRQPWVQLSLKYEDSSGRAAAFMAAFPEQRYRSRSKSYHINKGATDNLVCPRVVLPDSFESYLEGLGKNMRAKIRRFNRKYLDSGALRLSWAKGGDAGQAIELLLAHWLVTWTPSKGRSKANKAAHNYRKMLTHANDLGLLRMPVLWQGDRCLGVLGHVLDCRHRRIHFIVSGRDETVGGNYIGPLLHAQSVRWGIKNGYAIYDLCHGNEPYKFSYGAEEARVNYLSIRPRTLPAKGARLDPISTPLGLQRVVGFLEQGKTDQALAAVRQLQPLIAGESSVA